MSEKFYVYAVQSGYKSEGLSLYALYKEESKAMETAELLLLGAQAKVDRIYGEKEGIPFTDYDKKRYKEMTRVKNEMEAFWREELICSWSNINEEITVEKILVL
jgi:hypothetical protein